MNRIESNRIEWSRIESNRIDANRRESTRAPLFRASNGERRRTPRDRRLGLARVPTNPTRRSPVESHHSSTHDSTNTYTTTSESDTAPITHIPFTPPPIRLQYDEPTYIPCIHNAHITHTQHTRPAKKTPTVDVASHTPSRTPPTHPPSTHPIVVPSVGSSDVGVFDECRGV